MVTPKIVVSSNFSPSQLERLRVLLSESFPGQDLYLSSNPTCNGVLYFGIRCPCSGLIWGRES